MPTLLVTGANRGLGLEFCRQYAIAGWQVLACCRHPAEAQALKTLAEQHLSLSIHALDLADFATVDKLSGKLAKESIDVLLCNAGVYPDSVENGFGRLDYPLWLHSFVVNTQAPVKLAEAFLPQLKRGERRLIVAISSLMGSMADNTSGGSLMYRSSKAALNAAMKSLALDLAAQRVGVLILHPGWVRTDMGGQNAPLAPSESVKGMRQAIEAYSPSDSGRFVDFRGKVAPW
jgi:NAD(P)-dependent dehydrogenase (short-subunit alcohol dehydrogenase family)